MSIILLFILPTSLVAGSLYGLDSKSTFQSRENVIDAIRKLEKGQASAPRRTGEQSSQELVLIGVFEDPSYTYEDLLRKAKDLSGTTNDEATKSVLTKYVVTLEKMLGNKKVREAERNEIKKLIYSLRNQRDFAFFTTDDPSSPAAKLLAIGKDAIPYLIDELENEEFTRSVSPQVATNRKILSPMYVLRIGDSHMPS